MRLQPLENKALSQGIIRRSACILAEITIRKSQLGALPAQEALWLCLDATFSDFLLVVDGFDARSRLGSTLAICDL
jgi:hypothetical protein